MAGRYIAQFATQDDDLPEEDEEDTGVISWYYEKDNEETMKSTTKRTMKRTPSILYAGNQTLLTP